MTATVETVSEQLDLAAIIPAEKVVSAVARAITLSETDVATDTAPADVPSLEDQDQHYDSDMNDRLSDLWQTSSGKFKLIIEQLPQYLQYIYQLLHELCNMENPDILYYMLQCVNVLCLNGDAFTKASKDHHGFFIWAQENILIKNLWQLCNAEHSHICEATVPLLLHCITLPTGADVFWKIIQEEFHSSDWRVRFVAVERVTVIARFMDSTPLRAMMSLQAALANAFCYLISSIDDTNVYVAQRATLYLGTIHDAAIKGLVMCLETQFDTVIVDRPMVLQSLYQLHNSLSDRKILTWEFFLNRFDTLFIEAQINLERTGDISYFRDLRNTDMNSEVFIRKLHRAHEALSQSDGSGTSSVKTLSASFGTKWPYKRTMSAPASIVPRHDSKQEKEKVYSRQYSAPILKRKSSHFGLDGHVHSFNTLEDGNLINFLHRVIEFEEADRETMHLLVFLLMQFLSRSDQAYPTDEKYMSKSQNIVLRHLYLLLGYNQNERGLYIPPQRLRISPVFSAFLSNLPQLLDQNHLMGWVMLNTSLILLQYCPMPTADQPLRTYSLWSLEPHARRCWLMSLVVLLYKYQYTQQPQCQQLQELVRIVLNTLDFQHHHCRRIPATIVIGGTQTRSRDVSQPSLGTDNEQVDRIITPPLSPMYAGNEQSGHMITNTKAGKMQIAFQQKPLSTSTMETHWEEKESSNKEKKSCGKLELSLDADETDSELNAIPESDLSDSTLHESEQNIFEENAEENCTKLTEYNNDNGVVWSNSNNAQVPLNKKPMWFIGNEEETVQTNLKKWGVQEGVKMLVSSSLLSNNFGLQASQKVNDTRNCSMQSSFGSSKLAGTVAAIAAVSSIPGNKTISTDSQRNSKMVLSDEKTKSASFMKNSISKEEHLYDTLKTSIHTPGSTDSASDNSTTQQLEETWPADFNNHHNNKNYKSLLAAPSIERLLPIGVMKLSDSKLSNKQVRDNSNETLSPDSPLSKMEIISQDSTKEYATNNNNSPELISLDLESKLDVPAQERLLPVGTQCKEISQLVEKVKQALGLPLEGLKEAEEIRENKLSSIENKFSEHLSRRSTQKQSVSPKRLIKQVALESPTNIAELDERLPITKQVQQNNKKATNQQQIQRMCKSSSNVVVSQIFNDSQCKRSSWNTPSLTNWLDLESQHLCHSSIDMKQSSFRTGDECVTGRCSECGMVLEEYSDEEIGLCIIILGTFIHREPALAAPLLPDILSIVAKVAVNAMYPWQIESNIHLPGGAISVAHQFLRCILHQLAPNGVFIQMFQTQATESARTQFFRSVSQALLDFNELNPIAPLQLLLECLNTKKTLASDTLFVIFQNIACYLDCLPIDSGLGPTTPLWNPMLSQLETLFRRTVFLLNNLEDVTPLLRIMITVLKISAIAQYKGILDPFSKVLSHAIQTQTLEYHYLVELCYLCNRAFNKERDKLILCRMMIFELVQALKFKISIPDSNFLMLINLILQDVGGVIPNSVLLNTSHKYNTEYLHIFNTSISDCMRHHLGDILDFLTDFHALNKIKSYCKGTSIGLNDDTIGGIVKSSMAQYVALEITRSNGRDNRAVIKYFPWLCNTTTLQQGAREFLECIGHVRLLSWLLLGSLTHTAVHGGNHTPALLSQPIPQEASCQIADHIQVIMNGFSEQPKASVLHMSSLFHVFVLCQLWTVYLENGITTSLNSSELYNTTMNILFDFWGKVTPSVLQLASHSKMLSEMVSLHFLCMLEALIESRSTFLCKLLPLWTPIIFSHHVNLPGHLHVRLQNCRNCAPIVSTQIFPSKMKQTANNPVLLWWLQRLQFKMGQIELQSSTATQFYTL